MFQSAVSAGIGAAALFGAVIPVSKILLTGIGPVTLAALLYLGAGSGLFLMKVMPFRKMVRSEAPVTREDIPALVIIIAAGSIAGPVLLMTGLTTVPAATASLLLNGELVMTAIIAGIFFSEHLGRRTMLAAGLVVSGGLIISYDPTETLLVSPGAVLILGACFCWGIDNTVTRLISAKEPATIVILKGCCAGFFGLILAQMMGEATPQLPDIGIALLVGFLGYGLSLLLFIKSIRDLGTVRTGSLFACAPFIGVLVSYLLLNEVPGLLTGIALPLMAIGAYLIATEQHNHPHTHQVISHDHRHRHDDGHHIHYHNAAVITNHAHEHGHGELTHEHRHTPDIHHHHIHDEKEDA